jgi:hypothetical protein
MNKPRPNLMVTRGEIKSPLEAGMAKLRVASLSHRRDGGCSTSSSPTSKPMGKEGTSLDIMMELFQYAMFYLLVYNVLQ